MRFSHACAITALAGGITITGVFALVSPDQAQAQAKRANVVMLMMDDVGWSDSVRTQDVARRSDTRLPTLIALPKKV